jgi:hypothetical protein
MSLREAVPKPLRGPVGFASLGVMILGIATGYIITILGITLYFQLHGPPVEGNISTSESIQVTVVGLLCLVSGYLGWKGFLYFSY